MFADLPVNFYVDGVPRLLTQGSGDHRVIVTVDGFNIMIFFVSTGISATVHVRPNSVSEHIIEIPGSLTIYICLPDDNPDIVDVMGLLGTPNQNLEDDWMDANGNTITKWSINAFDYCTNTWCIRDETDSVFTYDAGYDFAHYQRCDDPKWTRQLSTSPEPSEEVELICAQVHNDTDCLFDGANGGVQAAEIAVEAIQNLEKQRKEALLAKTQDDVACCSSNFKTCDPNCGPNKHSCATCRDGESFIWLAKGPYEDAEDHGLLVDCAVKQATCSVSHECCPGMDCIDGTCTPGATNTHSRRLMEWVFERPDLPLDRTIITYSDL